MVMTIDDYKDTLNLPKTNFPMKANLAVREPKLLQKWQELDIYNKIQQKTSTSNNSFILNDGPPYANGAIHIGHALNKILKDIIVKYMNLKGFKSPFIPGWDCHGLPIELNVEKKYGKAGVKITAKEFRNKCREYAKKQVELQRDAFVRLGIFADWYNPYITMDYKFEANIIRTLGRIIKNNHLTKGDRPVHWCIDCSSALAEAEVIYMDKISKSIYVTFAGDAELKNLVAIDDKENLSVIIWTTTPWTLPANEAVAVNAEYSYVVLQILDQHYLLAKDLVSKVIETLAIKNYKIVTEIKGKALENIKLKHPFLDKTVPIILGEHVTLDAGTGCVHTAPAHGYEDYIAGLKYNLPIENPVLANGCFNSNIDIIANMHIKDANNKIIELLTINNKLLHVNELNHSYPHCWRHKTPLIFRATSQWFVSMQKNNLRKVAMAEVNNIKWIPDWGQERINLMLDNRPDWCISRQRTWGVPLPLLVHKETGELHPQTLDIIAKVAAQVESSGIDAWFDLDLATILTASEAEQYEKVIDTLDVWFDSGAVYACVLEENPDLTMPADLYLEGSDQHRGWFQTSLLSAVATTGKSPYKAALTHGFTVDANGRKMSKSLGNVIAPEKVIKTLGADILRLWVAATDYKAELHVSDEILKRTSDAYRKIRNTARFLLANLHDFIPSKHLIESKNLLALDSWIITKAKQLQKEILESYESYNFHVIYQKIHNFCSNELGSFYLDIIKDRQYTCKADSNPRRSAQTALYYIAEYFVRWIAPILSFTAEEIWLELPERQQDSVFLSDFYNLDINLEHNNDFDANYWQELIAVKNAVNKVLESKRQSQEIGSPLEAEVTLICSKKLYDKLSKLKDELRFVLITSQASITVDYIDNAVDTEISELKVLVTASSYDKCVRCWHYREDVNTNTDYPHICSRCISNLQDGEQRVFA